MFSKHWYDDTCFIQTYHAQPRKVPGFLLPLSPTRIITIIGPYNPFYQLLLNFIERSGDEWENFTFIDIVTEMLTFIEECNFHNFSLIILMADKTEGELYSCNFNMPPLQVRTIDEKRIELNQTNPFPLQNDNLVVDTIRLELVDILFATESWVAYHLFGRHHRHINFKKDILFLLRQFGIPDSFDGVEQFLLLNNQSECNADIVQQRTLQARIASLIEFEEEFEHTVERFFSSESRNATAAFVLHELLMNAYEYGVLGIDPGEKQNAMQRGSYMHWVQMVEKMHPGKIDIQIDVYRNNTLRVTIDDYGNGFKPELIEQNVSGAYEYHGRGIGMVAQMIDALFYAKNGSQVIFYLRYDTPDWNLFPPELVAEFEQLRLLAIGMEGESCCKELGSQTHQLLQATDAAEGVQTARQLLPGFVLLNEDSQVKTLNLTKQLKAVLGDAPIIRFCNSYDEDAFVQMIKNGIDLISPPVRNSAHLKELILRVLQFRDYRSNADRFVFQKVEEKRDLRAQNRYYRDQQAKAFEKQQLVIKNDASDITWIQQQLLYKPLEILSGDIYGAHKIDEHAFCSYIIDSMGKGLAASVTSILSAAFLNRALTIARESDRFSTEGLVDEFIAFVTPNLLEGEVLSFAFIYCDKKRAKLQYVAFGMYPLLYKSPALMECNVVRSKHPPLMRHASGYTVTELPLYDNFEMLFYSDGLCEMEGFAIKELVELFENTQGYAHFSERLNEAMQDEEHTDDITMLYFTAE